MIPWELLDSTPTPDQTGELCLYRRDDEFSIRINNQELMNSRAHSSEEALAELSCRKISHLRYPKVLIGGLGMGFTTATALRHLGVEAQVTIAELVPAVVEWNREYLGELTGHPLRDIRIKIREQDVAKLIQTVEDFYDVIILDVDNGPDGLTQPGNSRLYSMTGLHAIKKALRPNGVLAVWSAKPSREFTQRLKKAGFKVEEEKARARGSKGGGKHVIWLAQRG
ncbi:MAG TPA: MnmC family methyltransferase [Geopsychrobacteraceae bacterium]|nr:MnmC family methyltransferase [Geopsychrobacteraceae bacterium]